MENSKTRTKTNLLSEGAVLIAMAVILSYFKAKFAWAQGGSVDLVMVPILIFAFRWGVGWGIGAGLIAGTLKYFLAAGFAVNWQSMLLDYSVAYAVVGLAGLFKGTTVRSVVCGTLLGGISRFVVHFISGITIYKATVDSPGIFFDKEYANAWLYSFLYNGTYMLGCIVLALVVIVLLQKQMAEFFKRTNLM